MGLPADASEIFRNYISMGVLRLVLLLSAEDGGVTAPTITGGTAAPSLAEPDGSIYHRTNGSVYTRAGSAWIEVHPDSILRRAFVTVTPAELRALAATQKELVAAPGATKYLEYVSAHLWLDYDTVAHNAPTNAGDDLGIRYTNGAGQLVAVQEATGLINAGADAHRHLMAGASPTGTATDVAPVANAALVLDNIGAAEYSGTGDSPLKIEVLYRVRTLEPTS